MRSAFSSTVVRFLLPILPVFVLAACETDEGEEVAGALVADVIEVEAEFLNPWGVIHDPEADVYLVANVNGPPLDRDENGFISQVSPDGDVLDLRWAQTVGPDSRLHAPKGMAIRGDSLFVADVGCLRILDRESAMAQGSRCLDGVTSLRGIDVGPEGSLFVTDSGFEPEGEGMVPSGTDAIYRLVADEEGRGATIARDPDLGHPTGIAVGSRGIFVVTATGGILRFTPEGDRTDVLTRPGERFEGVVFLADGGFAYTSESESAIFLVDGQGRMHTVMEDIDAPGDLGYDIQRHRLLVPLYRENRVLLIDLE